MKKTCLSDDELNQLISIHQDFSDAAVDLEIIHLAAYHGLTTTDLTNYFGFEFNDGEKPLLMESRIRSILRRGGIKNASAGVLYGTFIRREVEGGADFDELLKITKLTPGRLNGYLQRIGEQLGGDPKFTRLTKDKKTIQQMNNSTKLSGTSS